MPSKPISVGLWLTMLSVSTAQMLYPADVFAQTNIQPGLIDVTKPPFNADSTGERDAAAAIIAVC